MLKFDWEPFPQLHSNRLILRQIVDADVENVMAIRCDEETMVYIPREIMTNIDQAYEHIRANEKYVEDRLGINFGVSLIDDRKLIAMVGIYRINVDNHRGEVGYVINKGYQGQGIITEAINRLVKYAFDEMNFNSLEAIIEPENIASARVIEKVGFTKEGQITQRSYWKGKYHDEMVYTMLRSQFEQ